MTEHKLFLYGSDEYMQALALRDKVLRQPLGLKFTEQELQKDVDDLHFGLFNNGEIIACLTLVKSVDGKVKMRQMAVAAEWQRKGKGKELLLEAEKYCRMNKDILIYCHARKNAVPFYEALNYKIVSDEFTEVGIPHYVMEKSLV